MEKTCSGSRKSGKKKKKKKKMMQYFSENPQKTDVPKEKFQKNMKKMPTTNRDVYISSLAIAESIYVTIPRYQSPQMSHFQQYGNVARKCNFLPKPFPSKNLL